MKFHHSNFLHSQVERSIQCILGLEPIDLLQPSQPSSEEPADGGPHENEQPLSASHPLLTHVSIFLNSTLSRIYIRRLFYSETSCKGGGGRGVPRTSKMGNKDYLRSPFIHIHSVHSSQFPFCFLLISVGFLFSGRTSASHR